MVDDKLTNDLKIIDPFVAHAFADKSEIRPILDFLCTCGIRPWIDEMDLRGAVGLNLRRILKRTIQADRPVCFILFISQNSVQRPWVNDEIRMLIEVRDKGARMLPIFLEETEINPESPLYSVLYPEGQRDIIYLKKTDPEFKHKLVNSIYDHFKLSQMESIVIHSGHRLPWTRIEIPEEWQDCNILDFRPKLGDNPRDYSPSAREWKRILKGLSIGKKFLLKLKTIQLCGFGPVGFAAALSLPWGRGSGIVLECWNQRTSQIWSCKHEPTNWPLETSLIKVHTPVDDLETEKAAIYIGNRADVSEDVKEFVMDNKPVLWVETPTLITSSVANLVNQVLGLILFVLKGVKEIDLFLAVPFGLAGLISWNLSSTPVTIYDNSKTGRAKYVKVFSIT